MSMDLSLLITLGIIFIATLVGSALRASAKDRCLADFDDFHVTVERKNGHLCWGILHLHATGAELEYREDVLDEQRHVETSYVIYKNEYPDVQGFYRYADDLTPEGKKKRDRSCERAFHPNLLRYFWRQGRNFLNTATGSFSEAVTLVLGRSKAVTNQLVLKQGQTEIKGLTKNILGYAGTSYDALLEGFIGAQVVVEVTYGDKTYEYVGVLKNYSVAFLEMLDIYFPQELKLTISKEDLAQQALKRGGCRSPGMRAIFTSATRRSIRRSSGPLAVGREDDINLIVNPSGELRYALPAHASQVILTCRLVRQLDMILPRAHSLIRHRAERYQPSDVPKLPVSLVLSSDSGQRYPRLQLGDEGDDLRNFEMLLLSQALLQEASKNL